MAASPSTIAEQVADLRGKRAATADEAARLEQEARGRDTPPEGVQAPGSPFPDGDLIDAESRPTTLRETLDGIPGVVVFYRGAWCPFCNITLHTYQQSLVFPLTERGVRLVAISPQKPDGSLTMTEKHDLQFPVLSDPGNQIARALGILKPPVEGVALSAEIAQLNADGTATVPMPTVAVIDAAGTLRWIDVHAEHTIRTEVAQILEAVDELQTRFDPKASTTP